MDGVAVAAHGGRVVPAEGSHLEVFGHREPRENTPTLGDLYDAEFDDVAGRTPLDRRAIEKDLPGPGRDDAADGHQRR